MYHYISRGLNLKDNSCTFLHIYIISKSHIVYLLCRVFFFRLLSHFEELKLPCRQYCCVKMQLLAQIDFVSITSSH